MLELTRFCGHLVTAARVRPQRFVQCAPARSGRVRSGRSRSVGGAGCRRSRGSRRRRAWPPGGSGTGRWAADRTARTPGSRTDSRRGRSSKRRCPSSRGRRAGAVLAPGRVSCTPSAVAVVNDAGHAPTAAVHGHRDGVDDQVGLAVAGHRPAQHLAAEHVDHAGQLEPALHGRHVGHVRDPQLVGAGRHELPPDPVPPARPGSAW